MRRKFECVVEWDEQDVTQHQPADMRASYGAYVLRPDSLVVTYRRAERERWQVTKVLVRGSRVLKGGVLGKDRPKWEVRSVFGRGVDVGDAPVWVRELVKAGDPVL